MRNIKQLSIVSTLATTLSFQVFAKTSIPQIDVLTGDTRTACEVILCLSSAQGKSISECQAPLRKYFSIKAKKWHQTLAKRRAFLDLCPAANENSKMSALTTAIQNQEYACDVATLNSRTESKRIRSYNNEGSTSLLLSRNMYRTQAYIPKFCEDLYKHEFTEYKDISIPKYTCDANKWYSQEDWDRGYTKEIVSKTWNSYNENYDYTYKETPIKKNCWQ